MKKQILLSVTIVIAVTLLVCCASIRIDGCNECEKKNGIIASKSLIPECKNTICMTYPEESPNIMPAQIINDMIRNYQQNQLTHINDKMFGGSTNNGDAQAIWFDLETLKKFIYNIEKFSKCNANISKEKLGIRIYYASYPEDNKDCIFKNKAGISKINWDINLDSIIKKGNYSERLNSSVRRQYINRHTLVMIPTVRIDNDNVDFNPYEVTSNREVLQYIFAPNENNCNEGVMSLTVFPQNSSSENPKAQNHGGLFPPRDMEGMVFKKIE